MAINGKKINELDGIIQSDLTNNTVVPAVVVQGSMPRETAIKVTLNQLKNWIVDDVGNPRIVDIPVQAGSTLSVTDANLIVMLFRNGNLLRILDDYTTTTNSITFTIPLEADEKITALYSIVAPFVIPVATTTTTGTVKFDGTTIKLNSNGQLYTEGSGGSIPTLTWYNVETEGNTLTIADTTSSPLVKVYKNGLLLQPTEDYTISGTTLTLTTSLQLTDKITTEVF